VTRSQDRDLVIEADHAERIGDLPAAVSKLRAHLILCADDDKIRLRLGRLLYAMAEPTSARQVLQPLDRAPDPDVWSHANRLLATIDEAEGALTSAQVRWERSLADDIDDPQARARLRALHPHEHAESEPWPADLALGTLVSPDGVRVSRFRLLRELGRGTSAAVYLVRDDRLNIDLALKVLHPQLAAAARADARETFFAEARLAARLRHPGVVAIYSIDEHSRCLAMEFVAGGTVRDRLRAVASINTSGVDAAEVLMTAQSLLGALAYVHAAGVVHGDLKPGNLLLRQPGQIVIADFGVAQFTPTGVADDQRTAGTPLYLAPEQFHGAPPSPRTDLFAAGAILWELIQGRPARRHSELLAGVYVPPPPIPEQRLLGIGTAGERLRVTIAQLMSPDPTQRPGDAMAALALLV
jgi:hypothetical protein